MPSKFAADEIRIFTRLRETGFRPSVIYDIGASNGVWSALMCQVFPDAIFHLFEPLAEIREDYWKRLKVQQASHQNLIMHAVALGARDGKVDMAVHYDGYSSTVLDTGENPEFQQRIRVDQHTLDRYVKENAVPLPIVIKIDTQGAERMILMHATECLRHAKVVFAETWLTRGYGPETPLLHELMELLSASDFVLTEIGHRFYDHRHGLYSCDAFFVKRDFLESVALSMPEDAW